MADFGQIFLSIDGEKISVKGNVTFNNLNLGEKTFEANMDRTMHSSFTPMVATAEIESLSACSVSIERLVELANRCYRTDDGDGIAVMFALGGACTADYRVIHFVNAQVGGTVNLDGSTGEVSGFIIASSDVLINGTAVRGTGA